MKKTGKAKATAPGQAKRKAAALAGTRGQLAAPGEVEVGPRVDWALWTSMPNVMVWHAAALAVGIDPDWLRFHPQSDFAGPSGPIFDSASFPTERARREFDRAVRLLHVAALTPDGPIEVKVPSVFGKVQESRIDLQEAASFLASKGWALPPELRPCQEPEKPQTAPRPQPGIEKQATSTTRTHKVKNRSDALAAVIKKAREAATDSAQWQSIWAALIKLAQSPDRPSPLLGYAEGEGVKYESDGVKFFTKDAFRKRMNPAARGK